MVPSKYVEYDDQITFTLKFLRKHDVSNIKKKCWRQRMTSYQDVANITAIFQAKFVEGLELVASTRSSRVIPDLQIEREQRRDEKLSLEGSIPSIQFHGTMFGKL